MDGTYKTLVISEIGQTVGTGWLPPRPDLGDFTGADPQIAEMEWVDSKRFGI